MSIREAKGREIAERYNITREGRLYLVPSQSGKGRYKVDVEKQRCNCPDFDFRRQPCKHLFAVQIVIEKTKTTTTKTDAEGNTTTTTTETVKVKRKTYAQPSWPAYHAAQVQEKKLFLYLLHQLCQGVGSPAQFNGRPRFSLEDMIFAMAFKVYSTVSGRRFMTDLKDAHGKGYISKLPCYNSVFNYFESEVLTPYLLMLIEESALPLAAIEEDFAIDSTGLSTGARQKWHDTKWGANVRLFGGKGKIGVDRKDWLKLHICTGVKTNVITAVAITESNAADSLEFPALVKATSENFAMRQVSADKAYSAGYNMKAVVEAQAMPYIAFRSNTTGSHASELFRKMFHFFSYNKERFLANYHKRSNVESTFHMVKSKFGDGLRSKTKTAQINESLCKVLCHNICCLIASMFELGLKPKFWSVAA